MRLIPYLTFPGNAQEAILFYQSVFGGDIPFLQRYKDTPMESDDSCKNKILHGVFRFNGQEIYFSDGFEGMDICMGDNITLAVEFDTYEEIEQIYKKLKENGKVKIELHEAFWGATIANLTDQYGINWNLNYDAKSP